MAKRRCFYSVLACKRFLAFELDSQSQCHPIHIVEIRNYGGHIMNGAILQAGVSQCLDVVCRHLSRA